MLITHSVPHINRSTSLCWLKYCTMLSISYLMLSNANDYNNVHTGEQTSNLIRTSARIQWRWCKVYFWLENRPFTYIRSTVCQKYGDSTACWLLIHKLNLLPILSCSIRKMYDFRTKSKSLTACISIRMRVKFDVLLLCVQFTCLYIRNDIYQAAVRVSMA